MATCRNCGKRSGKAALFCPACGASLVEPGPERRKLATVLECDVSGYTAMGERLDAEAVRELMFRYFHTMRSALERHGGTVEKFVGDAVMAVFGVPVAHEDDALRACRAAFEMRERLAELNKELRRRYGTRLAMRIGIDTGEVVAGDAATREAFVTGDAVNVAARLEKAAPTGEILLGELTHRLASRGIEAEPVEPVVAKGKSKRVAAYRLVSAIIGAPPQRPALTPLVAREWELAELRSRFEQAVADGRCVLATVVGEPGVGKTRLAAELSSFLAGQARVLTGRCLAYGDGITYWPLAEVVREAAAIRDEDSPADARAKLDRLVEAPFAAYIASAIGLDGDAAETGEIAWAFRELFASLANKRPLVLVVEDIHWAEETLRDLLVSVSERVAAPILLLATARPELVEEHREWPVAVTLEPLEAADAERLAGHLPALSEALRARLLVTARGNPLFLEELHAFLREHPEETDVPPSLSALLTARLDRLPEAERAAAERGAIEGELFHRGAVEALTKAAQRRDVAASLESLAARELVRPAQALFADEAAFRFKHVLVRDAAYNGTAKRLRADLHERFATWLEGVADDRITEYAEIVGYHLEQAYRYRLEFGPVDEAGQELARRAGKHLASAGTRASLRGDVRAAVGLLSRAEALLPTGDPDRLELLPELAASLGMSGEFARAESLRADALEHARAAGNERLERYVRVLMFHGTGGPRHKDAPEDVLKVLEETIPQLESDGDDRALASAWQRAAVAYIRLGRQEEREAALERAILHAERIGDEGKIGVLLGSLGGALNMGPLPVSDVIDRLEAIRPRTEGKPSQQAPILVQLAHAYAEAGRIDEARELVARGRTLREELGHRLNLAAGALQVQGWIELLAGDPVAAEEPLRKAVEILSEMGEQQILFEAACGLADALLAQGRDEEADDLCGLAAELAEDPPSWKQASWRELRARLLARRGRLAEAEALAREAVSMVDLMDMNDRPSPYLALGEVLHLSGRDAEAELAFREALHMFETKGRVVWATKVRAKLAGLAALTA